LLSLCVLLLHVFPCFVALISLCVQWSSSSCKRSSFTCSYFPPLLFIVVTFFLLPLHFLFLFAFPTNLMLFCFVLLISLHMQWSLFSYERFIPF
jgi:hypothetical protein